jgi:hypothetical protein
MKAIGATGRSVFHVALRPVVAGDLSSVLFSKCYDRSGWFLASLETASKRTLRNYIQAIGVGRH